MFVNAYRYRPPGGRNPHAYKSLIYRWLLVACLSVAAQVSIAQIEQWSISVFDENIAFPLTRFAPFHPGLEIGATLRQSDRPASVRQLNAYLGGYYHRRVETGIYLRGEYLHRLKVGTRLGVDMAGGIGYLHTFYPGTLYRQDEESGNLESVTQFGRPHAIATIGLGLTYRTQNRVAPFLRQDLVLEAPFVNSYPVIVHSFLKVGIHYTIN